MDTRYNLIMDDEGRKMSIQPYALGFKPIGPNPIGDFAFMAKQNSRKINDQLTQIGNALSSGQVRGSLRDLVMRDLTVLNDSLRMAAGVETTGVFNIGDIEDQLEHGEEY